MRKYRSRKIWIPSNGRKMKLLILLPVGKVQLRTGVLWIHGGGYAAGMPEMVYFTRAKDLVVKSGAVVVSPDYRLFGKAPYPAALMDCHAALKYMLEYADELGIRSDQLMVGGESAGGGLTAALCMYEKDIGGIRIAFQMPLYPMLDDRDTESSKNNHALVWNTRRNYHAWRIYLRRFAHKEVPCYAAPARREDYSGLPPAYSFVSTAEPFYMEAVEYVQNLRSAGIKAGMNVYRGLFHAFDMFMPFHPASRHAAREFIRHFAYAQKHFFAPQESIEEKDY